MAGLVAENRRGCRGWGEGCPGQSCCFLSFSEVRKGGERSDNPWRGVTSSPKIGVGQAAEKLQTRDQANGKRAHCNPARKGESVTESRWEAVARGLWTGGVTCCRGSRGVTLRDGVPCLALSAHTAQCSFLGQSFSLTPC